MKAVYVALVIFAFCVMDACASPRTSRQRHAPAPAPAAFEILAPAPVPEPPPAAKTAEPPREPAPPAAPARTLDFVEGMERVSDADVEGSLERWAEGNEIDLEHVVKRVGVFVEVAAIIKWDGNKKRERNPADHDRIVRESTEQAIALVAAARAGKKDEIKGRSDKLLSSCVECHTKYK